MVYKKRRWRHLGRPATPSSGYSTGKGRQSCQDGGVSFSWDDVVFRLQGRWQINFTKHLSQVDFHISAHLRNRNIIRASLKRVFAAFANLRQRSVHPRNDDAEWDDQPNHV